MLYWYKRCLWSSQLCQTFLKLSKRGAPKYLILLLDSWYSSQRLFVKRGQIISPAFGMSNGIRQGSKLSPHLFNVYIGQLSLDLQNSRVGCHIAGKAANHFGYADDLALISPSVKGLNALLEICDRFAKQNDIIFSTTKSKCMMIHAGRRQAPKLCTTSRLFEQWCIGVYWKLPLPWPHYYH